MGVPAARDKRPGILYGLAVGVLIAVYHAVGRFRRDAWVGCRRSASTGGVSSSSCAAHDDAGCCNGGGRPVRSPVGTGSLCCSSASCRPLAYMFILIAIEFAPVSVVAPAREVSVVLVGLAGWLMFQ